MLSILVNFVVIFLIFLAQFRIGRWALSYAARRWSAGGQRRLRVMLQMGGGVLLIGFLLGFTEIRAGLPFTSPLVGIFSGTAQLWLFTTTCVYALYLLFRLLTRRMRPAPFDPSRRRLVNSAGGALLATPFLVAGYGALIERTNFQVREVDVPIPDLPGELEGLRLVQVSDIHLSPFLSESELARVIDAANQARGHLALVTGDLISSRGDPLDACLRQLARLKTDAGTLGCLGNHEHYADAERYTTEQGERLGIQFLRDTNRQFRFGGATLNFAGVDYQRVSMHHAGYLRGAERLIVPGAVNVLLSHNPDVFPTAAAQGYNLTVSGHTHGGQVTIEILSRTINPARFFTPYVYGLYRRAEGGRQAAAYVSRGIGTIGVPARVGAPPEISILRLQKA